MPIPASRSGHATQPSFCVPSSPLWLLTDRPAKSNPRYWPLDLDNGTCTPLHVIFGNLVESVESRDRRSAAGRCLEWIHRKVVQNRVEKIKTPWILNHTNVLARSSSGIFGAFILLVFTFHFFPEEKGLAGVQGWQ